MTTTTKSSIAVDPASPKLHHGGHEQQRYGTLELLNQILADERRRGQQRPLDGGRAAHERNAALVRVRTPGRYGTGRRGMSAT